MKRQMGRDEVLELTQLLASFYAEHRKILSLDDRKAFCHAHRVIEELSKSKQYNPTKEFIAVDIDSNEFEGHQTQDQAYWSYCGNMLDL